MSHCLVLYNFSSCLWNRRKSIIFRFLCLSFLYILKSSLSFHASSLILIFSLSILLNFLSMPFTCFLFIFFFILLQLIVLYIYIVVSFFCIPISESHHPFIFYLIFFSSSFQRRIIVFVFYLNSLFLIVIIPPSSCSEIVLFT